MPSTCVDKTAQPLPPDLGQTVATAGIFASASIGFGRHSDRRTPPVLRAGLLFCGLATRKPARRSATAIGARNIYDSAGRAWRRAHDNPIHIRDTETARVGSRASCGQKRRTTPQLRNARTARRSEIRDPWRCNAKGWSRAAAIHLGEAGPVACASIRCRCQPKENVRLLNWASSRAEGRQTRHKRHPRTDIVAVHESGHGTRRKVSALQQTSAAIRGTRDAASQSMPCLPMTQSRPGQGAPLRRTIASALNAKSAET
jgi:hypothetical protein